MSNRLLTLTDAGLYCPAGDFHIDPHRPVARAVVTHGHADHCRPGAASLLATPETAAIAAVRYGETAFGSVQTLRCGEGLRIGDATLRFAPAGHVLGSAQVVIDTDGGRAVVSGDYKRRPDPGCDDFELVECDLFVTEATFALPVFRHPPAESQIAKLLHSLTLFPERAHVIGTYALGKAQRLILELRAAGHDAPVFVHGALRKLCDLYETLGIGLGRLENATVAEKDRMKGAIVLAPPSAIADRWARRLPEPVVGMASGWMTVRQRAKQRGVELPLILSDHADWPELIDTVQAVKAAEVWITHGREDALAHWCTTHSIAARPLAIAGREGEDGD